MKRILAIGALAALTGCATGIQGETVVGGAGSPMWFMTASRPTQLAFFKRVCSDYGIKDETMAMTQCLQTEMRSARQRAHEAAMDMGKSSTTAMPKTIQCHRMGAYVNCTEF
jgi:hypothetical protein